MVAAQTPEKLSLRQGQQKAIPASRIIVKFVSVIEDSRCPQGVTCIWAGVARIKLQLRKKGKPAQEFELNTNQMDKAITYEGYEIKLAALSPYPKSSTAIKPAVYSATLTKTKLRK